MVNLNDFKRQKDFLVCVDSDGCAMDTMDIKHFNCFGPCMVEEWGLEEWKEPILERWNEINLYSMTRGINRFLGLAMALTEINKTYRKIEGIEEFDAWTKAAAELSNDALSKAIDSDKGPCFEKALSWSKKVNEGINALPDDAKKPYDGVKECLEAAHAFADVAVVSSANREAVVEEWERCALSDSVDVLCCQDAGSKAFCIETLKAQGYEPDHILMVGDAPGDKAAAEKNGVCYYPILVQHEGESWSELKETGLEKFRGLDYKTYGEEKARQFITNLGGEQ